MDEEEERVPRIGELQIHIQPEYFLSKAQHQLSLGNNVLAMQHYFEYVRQLGDVHKMQLSDQIRLTKLVINISETLVETGNIVDSEIIKCYLNMLNHFPDNVIILNSFGVYFFSKGEFGVARTYLEKAAKLGYLPAEKNLLHAIWHLIPRWHFRMLNDRKRNEAFRDAITKAVVAGNTNIYDIGTGCGLLTLIAKRANKDVSVVAIEQSKLLCDLANRIIKENDLKDITVVNADSTMTENKGPCNLIVTEIFDAAVFGEDCLKTIKHAHDTFVTVKNFRIIPLSARLYITAFESHELTRKIRYTETLPELKLENICIVEADPEPYDADFLKNRNVKYLSDTKQFLEVLFYSKRQIINLLNPESNCIPQVKIVFKESGIIHGLAVWFDLHLDKEIKISTHPDSDITCWEQAVFHLDHPIKVKKGDVLKLKPRIVEGQLHFDVLNYDNTCEQCFEVTPEIISFLNDTELVQSIVRAADSYASADVRVVDFNVFPLFGFMMAKKGATVYHVYNDECDLTLFNHVMSLNELPSHKFIFIHQKAVEEYMVYLEPPNIVFRDLIRKDGSWNKMEYTLEMEAKLNCEALPKKVLMHCQLISSDYLDYCNKVDDSNALDFQISKHMSTCQGNEHPSLETLEHEKHSSVITFDISDLDKFDLHMEGDIIKDGNCNAILYWFDIQYTDDESNVFNTLNSFHYEKTCTLFANPKCVKAGEKIMFHIMRYEGHLKVYCD